MYYMFFDFLTRQFSNFWMMCLCEILMFAVTFCIALRFYKKVKLFDGAVFFAIDGIIFGVVYSIILLFELNVNHYPIFFTMIEFLIALLGLAFVVLKNIRNPLYLILGILFSFMFGYFIAFVIRLVLVLLAYYLIVSLIIFIGGIVVLFFIF